jgi:thioredoxin-like negative regulator of GroEL
VIDRHNASAPSHVVTVRDNIGETFLPRFVALSSSWRSLRVPGQTLSVGGAVLMRLRLVLLIFSVVLIGAVAAWAGLRAYDNWRDEAEMAVAAREVGAKQYESAKLRLRRLTRRHPRDGEAALQLGNCELALGDPAAAMASWAQVPKNSPVAPRAALLRAGELLKVAHYADAEPLLVECLNAQGPLSYEAWQTLAYLLKIEGRLAEVRSLFRAHYREMPNPDAGLQELWRLDYHVYPVQEFAAVLRDALRNAPDDHRVWLGRVNLAIRSGKLDEAELLLNRHAPDPTDDASIWRARIEWAQAAERPEEAAVAVEHLDAEHFDPVEVHGLAAWFAARRGDFESERRAWLAVIALTPGYPGALDRLAELALGDSNREQADQYYARKAAMAKHRVRYDALLFGPAPTEHLLELANLAAEIGQTFEARAWAAMAAAQDPADAAPRTILAKLGPSRVRSDESAKLLAELARDVGHGDAKRSEIVSRDSRRTPYFTDDASVSGLKFTYDSGHSEQRQIPETSGGGVGLLDYDNDGFLDVYLVQGGAFPPDPSRPNQGDRLFRNRGDGTFDDVTAASALSEMPRGYGHGVTVGDYDNDGYPDVFVTRWRSYALYHNLGDGTFEDATAAVGFAGDRDWPTSAAFADLDGDGELDLYVCHYLAWDPGHPRVCRNENLQRVVSCSPREFTPMPDHVFRNDGHRFVDVTAEAGFSEREGRGLGVVAADLDGDYRIDVFVANDMSANYMFRNQGQFHFEEVGQAAGAASSAEGTYKAGMGIACGDLDGDGLVDLAVGNFYGESATFYHNLGQGLFADHSSAVGLLAPTRYVLSFGMAFLDSDNDAHLDLAVANGNVDDLRPAGPFEMVTQLLTGDANGRLKDMTARAGRPWSVPRIGRGLAIGDLDNDGRIDVILFPEDSPIGYFRNRTAGAGHWLSLRLEGTQSNRDAVGASVTVVAGGRRQVAQRFGGGSYQSACDGRLHFGLGAVDRVKAIEVTWPSGKVERFQSVEVDHAYAIREGIGVIAAFNAGKP